MFMYLLISHESHFQFGVLPHVHCADNFTAHYKVYEIPDFIRFKAPVTGFDFCKRSHHYITLTDTFILHKTDEHPLMCWKPKRDSR